MNIVSELNHFISHTLPFKCRFVHVVAVIKPANVMRSIDSNSYAYLNLERQWDGVCVCVCKTTHFQCDDTLRILKCTLCNWLTCRFGKMRTTDGSDVRERARGHIIIYMYSAHTHRYKWKWGEKERIWMNICLTLFDSSRLKTQLECDSSFNSNISC